jgi:type II secretory pathway component PulJ
MMVALSIGAFVIAGILSSYTFLGRNLFRYSNQQQLAAQTQRTLQIFAQDVHAATNVGSISGTVLQLQYSPSTIQLPSSTNVVTYTYNASAGTLVRTVTGTLPSGLAIASSLNLLSGISPSVSNFFNYYDQNNVAATNTLGVKKISIPTFTITSVTIGKSGKASANTQTSYTAASARLILRSKHLVTY